MPCPEPGGGHEATRPSRSFAWRDCVPVRDIHVAGKAMKKRSRKMAAPKRRNAPQAARRRKPAAGDPNKKIAQLTLERDELLEQQAATSEVLKIVGSAAGDLNSVFQAMLEKAVRICGAGFGNLWLREVDGFRIAAIHGAPREFQDCVRGELFRPSPNIGLGQIVNTKQVYQVDDVRAA